MKKLLFFTLATAVTLASCTSDETLNSQEEVKTESGVSFSVYTPSTTRAHIETQTSVQTKGFGVFAFSQMQEKINTYAKANFLPNFMYNQQVTYNGSEWVYEPIKYWPNNQDALVSFYAYAPYTAEFNDDKYTITPESNDYSSENTTTDFTNTRLVLGYDSFGPAIEYTRSSVATEGIDLLWGQEEGQTLAPVDKLKQNIDEKIKFNFKHAMSRLHFNVQVWSDEYPVNKDDVNNATNPITEHTTIYIRKVELIGNFHNKGTLRLYDGTWKHDKGDYSNLVFEGEGQLAKAVLDGLKGNDASKEIDLLVGTSMKDDGSMLDPEAIDNFVMVMPNTTFYIQITYDVETIDPNNPKNSSTVTNVVKSTDFAAAVNPTGFAGSSADAAAKGKFTLEAGYAYNFHLNLGMTTVKFDANVEAWEPRTGEVALPENNPNPAP